MTEGAESVRQVEIPAFLSHERALLLDGCGDQGDGLQDLRVVRVNRAQLVHRTGRGDCRRLVSVGVRWRIAWGLEVLVVHGNSWRLLGAGVQFLIKVEGGVACVV